MLRVDLVEEGKRVESFTSLNFEPQKKREKFKSIFCNVTSPLPFQTKLIKAREMYVAAREVSIDLSLNALQYLRSKMRLQAPCQL